MKEKRNIKFILVAILLIIIIIVGVIVYNKYVKNNENITPPNINPRYVEYKHFKFMLPEGMEYASDEYKINVFGSGNWKVAIDPIIDLNLVIKNDVEKAQELLNEAGYIIDEGPIDRDSNYSKYFYYKVTYNGESRILAYQYFNSKYVFELEYESPDGEDGLSIIDSIMDSISAVTYDNSDTRYPFHAINSN